LQRIKPKVSVIVTTYNRKDELKRTIDSILNQSYIDFEIIVVDNFSNYNFIEFINTYKSEKIIPIQNSNHGIIAVNRNIGIENARGEFIAFCDDDDWWTSDKLEESIYYLNNGFDVIYHNMQVYDGDIQKMKRDIIKSRYLYKPVNKDLIINGNCIINSSVVVRKSIVDKVGNINTNRELVSSEDYDYWIKIALQTEKFKFLDKTLGVYTVHQTGVSHKDVNLPMRNVIKQYENLLSTNELKKAYSFISYYSLRKSLENPDIGLSRSNYIDCLLNGSVNIKIKATITVLQKYFGQI
jgi:glycosyltransferase involved in cell wall biosynthesis